MYKLHQASFPLDQQWNQVQA